MEWCSAKVTPYLTYTQTPSTGVQHPSFKKEGAGKRCSERAVYLELGFMCRKAMLGVCCIP